MKLSSLKKCLAEAEKSSSHSTNEITFIKTLRDFITDFENNFADNDIAFFHFKIFVTARKNEENLLGIWQQTRGPIGALLTSWQQEIDSTIKEKVVISPFPFFNVYSPNIQPNVSLDISFGGISFRNGINVHSQSQKNDKNTTEIPNSLNSNRPQYPYPLNSSSSTETSNTLDSEGSKLSQG